MHGSVTDGACRRNAAPGGMAVLLLLCLVAACAEKSPPGTVVYCAASMTDLMTGAAELNPGADGEGPAFEFASSGSLARKIEAGAPADVFVSANRDWMDYLGRKGLTEPGSRAIIARNRLVLAVPRGSGKRISSPADIAWLGSVSIGDPAHVPAGSYARQALEHFGLWERLRRGHRLVFGQSVRAALAAAEQGAVDAAVVYFSDARSSGRVRLAFVFPEDSHEPVEYFAAVVSGTGKRAAAGEFMDFLVSGPFRDLLTVHGFTVP